MPSDRGKWCWLPAAMNLKYGRVQTDGVDNDRDLTPCTFLKRAAISRTEHLSSVSVTAVWRPHSTCSYIPRILLDK